MSLCFLGYVGNLGLGVALLLGLTSQPNGLGSLYVPLLEEVALFHTCLASSPLFQPSSSEPSPDTLSVSSSQWMRVGSNSQAAPSVSREAQREQPRALALGVGRSYGTGQ